jgi:Tol biopolymer transport system component
MDWSPDGQSVVFEYREGGRSSIRLTTRTGDGWAAPVEIARMAGFPTGGTNPSFAPDGRSVVFLEPDGTVRIAAVSGGPLRTLTAGPDVNAVLAAWSEDGRSAYVLANRPKGAALWEVPLSGARRLLTTFEDPGRQPTRYGLAARGGRIYFTQGERQADISVVALGPAE